MSLLQVQREYLDTQIRGLSNSHVVQPGINREMVPLVPAHTRIKEIALPVQVCYRLCSAAPAVSSIMVGAQATTDVFSQVLCC